MASASPRDQLQQAAQTTKEQATGALNQQKETAASSLGSFAGALRKAARESDGGNQASTARMAEWAADGLERVSSTLRTKDLDGIMREVQSFARSQPVAFFCAAAAAGFLASRFFKAGTGGSRTESDFSGPQTDLPRPQTDFSRTQTDFSSTPRV